MATPDLPSSLRPRSALFSYGFRPFFLAAGIFAVAAIAAWLWVYATGRVPIPAWPPQLWHAHEMLYGFIGAAIAGFLLTAVPSWTGARGFAGAPLMMVTVAWLAGRIAFACATWLTLPVLAAGELIFIPALALLIAVPLLRARNRNTPLLLVLFVLWSTDVVFMFAVFHADVMLAGTALRTGINLVLLLVTVIGGRIVPSFTASALRAPGDNSGIRRAAWLERIVIGSMAVIIIVDVIAPYSAFAALIAGLAAIAQAGRLIGWRGLRTLRQPIVWVLHVAYAWLPIGLALKAVFLSSGADWASHWVHALTIGAAATMILAVMTRAALGHTGRPLVVAKRVAVAYGLLLLAAATRVFAPALGVMPYAVTVTTAGSLWIAAFGLYLSVYGPILVRPRVDGRPG
ncbi:MAG TPA: NnrS family protein [Steroidobacteraceae bacterium]|nr:NnrS family protein [Steroidobacteraceae bacterium]